MKVEEQIPVVHRVDNFMQFVCVCHYVRLVVAIHFIHRIAIHTLDKAVRVLNSWNEAFREL